MKFRITKGFDIDQKKLYHKEVATNLLAVFKITSKAGCFQSNKRFSTIDCHLPGGKVS